MTVRFTSYVVSPHIVLCSLPPVTEISIVRGTGPEEGTHVRSPPFETPFYKVRHSILSSLLSLSRSLSHSLALSHSLSLSLSHSLALSQALSRNLPPGSGSRLGFVADVGISAVQGLDEKEVGPRRLRRARSVRKRGWRREEATGASRLTGKYPATKSF